MDLDRAFSALADPTRRQLLVFLEPGEKTLSELASPLPISLMAVQKHVKVLEDAGLVATRKVGRSRHVRLRAHGLQHASQWIKESEKRWTAAFDRLEAALAEEAEEVAAQERRRNPAPDVQDGEPEDGIPPRKPDRPPLGP